MHISIARGAVWTDVPICTAQVADGASIDLRLHYESTHADGSVSLRQTVLGYGWTHSYNLHLIVRSRLVFLSDATGRLTGFRERIDGGYTSSAGESHTLSRIDADTFLLEKVDGRKLTFEPFDPAPWPEAGQFYQLTQIEDRHGQLTTLSYNGDGLLATITDPYGRQVSFTYNAKNRISTITSVDQQVTTLEYVNADDDLWRIIDPEGYPLEYTYDSHNRMVSEKLKDDNTWTCLYNGAGKPNQLIDSAQAVFVTVTNDQNWAIDLDHALQYEEVRYIPGETTVTGGCNSENVTTSHYDEYGCIDQVDHRDGSQSLYTYDGDLQLTDRWDEDNKHWHYVYDDHRNRILSVDPLENKTQMFYEHTIPNLMTGLIEPDDDPWAWFYDDFGNLTKEVDPIVEEPEDHVTTCEYEYYPDPPTGRLKKKTCADRNGHVAQWEYDEDGTLWRETVDPDNLAIVTEYEYDAAGRLTKKIVYRGPDFTDPVVTVLDYDAIGRLVQQIRDPAGLHLTTNYEYDGQGNITRWVTPRGVPTDYHYDPRGRLVTQTVDPGDPPDHLALTTFYAYDDCDNLTLIIDPNGNETIYQYDNRNRPIKAIDAEAYWTVYEYDRRDNRTHVHRSIDPGGPPFRTIQYQYDALSRITNEIVDPDGLHLTTAYEYALSGGGCDRGTPGRSLIHKTTDPDGKITYYYYDRLDRHTSEVRKVGDAEDNGGDADDAITTYDFDVMYSRSDIVFHNDPHADLVVHYKYDAADRLTERVIGPGGSNLATDFEYDGAGNIIEEITQYENVITYEYDKANSLRHVSDSLCDPGEYVATYHYDANGNLISVSNGLGHTWTYTYDHADRCITAHDPLVEEPEDTYSRYEYDDNGNLITATDNEGLVTTYTYDRLDRPATMTKDPFDPEVNPDGLDITITYAYDGAGSTVHITDDNGNTTLYAYDAANRLTHQSDADGTDVVFVHNGVGNVILRTDQMDNKTYYEYDDLHRLTARMYEYDPSISDDDFTDAFTYDRASQMLTADNEHSHIGYTYDDVGRISSCTQTDLPESYNYTINYAYTTSPNTRVLTYPGGKNVLEVRDLRNGLTEVWQNGVLTVSYTYENLGDRVLAKTFENGTEARYAYNQNNWVTELRHVAADGMTTFAGFAHEYDAVGNRLNAQNLQEVIPYQDAKPVTHSEVYEYDDIYRLIDYKRGEWIGGDIPAPRRHRTWQIDGVHNWEEFGIHDLDTGEDATYCNQINQMNEYDDPSDDGLPPIPDDDGLPDDFMVSPCDGLPFFGPVDGYSNSSQFAEALPDTGLNHAHDMNGNLVGRCNIDDTELWEYFYDYDHRPITEATWRAENRMTLVMHNGAIVGEYWYDALGRRARKLSGGVSTVYVYADYWRAVEEYENGELDRVYAYGDWIDEVLTMDRTVEADRFYYHADVLGSIIALTDGDGAPIERCTYDAFGAPSLFDGVGTTLPQSTVGNAYLFTGRRCESSIECYYYRSRYFDPMSGRFMTRDTIGMWGDLCNLGNGYSYVANAPFVNVDPMGLQTGGRRLTDQEVQELGKSGELFKGGYYHERGDATVWYEKPNREARERGWAAIPEHPWPPPRDPNRVVVGSYTTGQIDAMTPGQRWWIALHHDDPEVRWYFFDVALTPADREWWREEMDFGLSLLGAWYNLVLFGPFLVEAAPAVAPVVAHGARATGQAVGRAAVVGGQAVAHGGRVAGYHLWRILSSMMTNEGCWWPWISPWVRERLRDLLEWVLDIAEEYPRTPEGVADS
jgi:RHS repeat-associated protein